MPKNNASKTDFVSPLCRHCNHLCCNYITVKIPAPRTIRDFDGLLWQVSHDHIAALRDHQGWYLIVYSRCSHLTPNGKCGIYAKRPITCREHATENCEYQNGSIAESAYQYFGSYESLDAYGRQRFKTWGNRFG